MKGGNLNIVRVVVDSDSRRETVTPSSVIARTTHDTDSPARGGDPDDIVLRPRRLRHGRSSFGSGILTSLSDVRTVFQGLFVLGPTVTVGGRYEAPDGDSS